MSGKVDKASLIVGVVWGLGTRIVDAARKFSRRKTEHEQRVETATWQLNHIGIGPYSDTCVVCGLSGVNADDPCPGPPATQKARRQLDSGK